jgi:hypothetical protein
VIKTLSRANVLDHSLTPTCHRDQEHTYKRQAEQRRIHNDGQGQKLKALLGAGRSDNRQVKKNEQNESGEINTNKTAVRLERNQIQTAHIGEKSLSQ